MFRLLLRRYGVARLVVGLTAASVFGSLLLTTLLTYAMGGGGPGPTGLIIATVVPLVIAPSMSLQMLVLLNRLDQAEQRLRPLAITDELTQSFNRRYFIALAEGELARIKRHGGTCSLAILDLDGFKLVNDSLGHQAGDELLRAFSQLCREHLRASDTFARYGGDEFIMLLPATPPEMAHEVVDRIRGILARPAMDGGAPVAVAATAATAGNRHLSLSAGIASLDPAAPDLDQLVKRADDALYAAKRAGGNQVVGETG
jgi:diguanylate cyclase (GGDEF)-like protein